MENYSVLMSVYYKEKPEFLRRSIESVMDQTILTNDFVLVCDGPLTNELYSVINEEKKKYKVFNIVQLDKNEGLGIALSKGLLVTKNELVMRMDSDDVCVKERAEIQVPLMEQYDIVGGYISEFEDTEDNIIGYRKTPVNPEEIYKFSKKRTPFNHPTVMFKKSIILKAGNYQSLQYLEDYYLWVRVLQITNKVHNVDQVFVNMRSGREMRARRASRLARQSIRKLRKYMYNIKMINIIQCYLYTFLQNTFLLLPSKIKARLYNKKLRN